MLYFPDPQLQAEQCLCTVTVLDGISRSLFFFSTICFYRKCLTWSFDDKEYSFSGVTCTYLGSFFTCWCTRFDKSSVICYKYFQHMYIKHFAI